MKADEVKCVDCKQAVFKGSIDGYGTCRSCANDRRVANQAKSGLTSDFGPEAQAAIDAAIETFPATFKLRNHEGIFRISRTASYVSQGKILLYTQRLHTTQVQNGVARGQYQDEWQDFCKGSIEELKGQVVWRHFGQAPKVGQ